jgi:hypothetical protein
MKRRDFLKRAGQGTVALASAPALAQVLSGVAFGQGGSTNYHFLAFSSAGLVGSVDHRIAMVGDGSVTPGGVNGGGAFVHFDNAPPAPKPILGTGSWKAKRLLSYEQFGTWGTFASAVLEMDINLVPSGGSPVPAILTVVCNIGPAAIFVVPPSPEGFTLTIPGFLTFTPLVPALGLTLFTTVNEQRGSG